MINRESLNSDLINAQEGRKPPRNIDGELRQVWLNLNHRSDALRDAENAVSKAQAAQDDAQIEKALNARAVAKSAFDGASDHFRAVYRQAIRQAEIKQQQEGALLTFANAATAGIEHEKAELQRAHLLREQAETVERNAGKSLKAARYEFKKAANDAGLTFDDAMARVAELGGDVSALTVTETPGS